MNKSSNPLICIYTNENKNEFSIGLKEDETFRAVTKVGDFYTRFVDVRMLKMIELKKWIASAKNNESIFLEVDLKAWMKQVKESPSNVNSDGGVNNSIMFTDDDILNYLVIIET
jgi:hypothetical protein